MRHFTIEQYPLAVSEAQRQSMQHAGCAIHLSVMLRPFSTSTLKPPEIIGYQITDWYDESTVHTFVDGQAVGG